MVCALIFFVNLLFFLLFSLSQVGNITQMIAYPDQISNDTYLLENSRALSATQGQGYFKTVKLAQVFGAKDNLAEISNPVDKTE